VVADRLACSVGDDRADGRIPAVARLDAPGEGVGVETASEQGAESGAVCLDVVPAIGGGRTYIGVAEILAAIDAGVEDAGIARTKTIGQLEAGAGAAERQTDMARRRRSG